jgi:hypothetical protein
MLWRIVTIVVAASFALIGPAGAVIAAEDARDTRAILARVEDDDSVLATELDDDDDTGGGDDSDDGTNSQRTGVTRSNRDRSRGDLTRDLTKDGPGGSTRDRTQNRTNDRSRHDTR